MVHDGVPDAELAMFPTLHDVAAWLPPIDTHSAMVAVAFMAAGIVFLVERRRRRINDIRLIPIAGGAILGAAILARLGTWLQHLDFSRNLGFFDQLAYGNASILSGLVGAWLGAHVAKRLVRYPDRTGDLFAPAVALAMVFGRVGCFLTERPGTPTGGEWGIVLDQAAADRMHSMAGVPLHPSFIYEIIFHAAAFAVLWWWLRFRPIAAGETLTIYIAAYAIFRFFVEFVRGNDIAWLGLTRPQIFLLITIPLLVARLIWMLRTGKFRATPSNVAERMPLHGQHI
ncbi:prolipoprotein diacylglyceryl transferase [Microbacterium sp. YY-01]|uniref:prolipoprotein diacylglyceryl transferase n=1 Tax=Microbacterium sp. YY-01 TaxID=3421634 RepID=UPI003D16C49F